MPQATTDTTTDSQWDIEKTHVRLQVRRYTTGQVRARRVQRKRAGGEWADWAYWKRLTDADLSADTMPELREKAADLNRVARFWARGEEMEAALSRKRRRERAERRRRARQAFAQWADIEYGHLADAYHESPDKWRSTGGPAGGREPRPFVDWLGIYLSRTSEEEHSRFLAKWGALREQYDLPAHTHYL
jgi:hypothetical protein